VNLFLGDIDAARPVVVAALRAGRTAMTNVQRATIEELAEHVRYIHARLELRGNLGDSRWLEAGGHWAAVIRGTHADRVDGALALLTALRPEVIEGLQGKLDMTDFQMLATMEFAAIMKQLNAELAGGEGGVEK